MALFVYVCRECWDDARQHSLTNEVERFRDRVESTQSTSLFDPFPPPCLVKKKLGGRQGRLIADARHVGDHTVIVFLAIMIRGGHAYEADFARDAQGYWQQHFHHRVSEADLAAFIEDRTRTQPPVEKPKPSDLEYGLLYDAFTHQQVDASGDMVCETKEWVDQVTQDRIAKQLALLCKPCLEALNKPSGLHFIEVAGKPSWGVWALRSPGRLLLIVPSTDVTVEEARATARRIQEELEGKDATAVLRASRRAYPALILADDDLWIDLEKDPIANMALSPEESEVLESARRSASPFPLFINGRAGSGKSTILQYLFADLLYFYLSHAQSRAMAPPVYLTANGDLLRVARTFVERLLKSEAAFASDARSEFARENREVLDEAFREFQPHVLSLVPHDERLRLFARPNRVDYARFRRMWMERFGKEKHALRDYGPDLSWHVIRSYIKGMSSETYLEPEDYAHLPENQITVTHAAFKLVFDRVWTNWYEQEPDRNGLWDDQDLTRYVLDHDLARPLAPAIVCDEAQDFTRLELELLLRLSLFSNRTLTTGDLRRVPFAFAGDQFQTLNPTGFRWDAIKASFVEKFVFELSPSSRAGRVELNYRELKYNYRSTHKIVRFGNHVQALRAALFDMPDVRPQTPWSTETSSFPVVWFRADDGEFWKRFRENPGFVVLVPCNEGEEAEYVRSDPYLSAHVRVEDDVPINVLSAARAKGCEYPATIVYGFGQGIDLDLVSELETERTEATKDPDKALPVQYFVNRLYVAVSRPKKRLIIVDTEAGLRRVWRCAQDERVEARMLERIKNGRATWGTVIEGMTMGDVEDVTRESAGDQLENAKAFEAEGIARKDGFLLRQAMQAYRSGGDMPKAKECRARAYEADGANFEAGEAYFEAGFAAPDGVRCLWRAGHKGWIRLVELHGKSPHIQNEIEYQWARLATGKPTPSDVSELLGRLAGLIEDPTFAERCLTEPAWREALDAALKPMSDAARAGHIPDPILAQLVAALDRLRSWRIPVPEVASAALYFAVKRYPQALELWDKAGGAKPRDYDRAKASVEPYPERIRSLANLGLWDEIVQAFDDAPEVPLSDDQAAAVTEALAASGRGEDALGVAWKFECSAAMLKLAVESFTAGNRALATQALHAGLILLVQQGAWDAVVLFAATSEMTPSEVWAHSQVREWVKREASALQITLVRAMARSEKLPDVSKDEQRKLLEFLKRLLKGQDLGWKTHVSILEAGAAFERAGRFTETIGFYDLVVNGPFTQEEKLAAQQRRLVSRARQLNYERNLKANHQRVREIEGGLKREMAALHVKAVEGVNEYPRLEVLALPERRVEAPTSTPRTATAVSAPGDPGNGAPAVTASATAAAPDTVTMQIGAYRLEHSARVHRTNITHAETMSTAYVKSGSRTCGGEASFKRLGESQYACEEWGMVVRFQAIESEPVEARWDCEIEFREMGVLVQLGRVPALSVASDASVPRGVESGTSTD